jgi:hypothetical protein
LLLPSPSSKAYTHLVEFIEVPFACLHGFRALDPMATLLPSGEASVNTGIARLSRCIRYARLRA